MSVPYRVKGSDDNRNPNRDTWVSVARQHNPDVKKLIWFNFETENPDEVNWYLRRNVGCTLPTPDGRNWLFHDGAKPGIIYLPIDRVNMAPMVIQAKKTTSPFALEFEGPSSPLDTIGKLFDAFQLLDLGLAIAGVAAGEAVILGIGIATAPIAPFVVLGGMHEAPLNELRKKQMLEGLSLGIVLAAEGRTVRYIYDHGYFKRWPVRDINYPDYGKQLQGIYNQSLVAGIAHGREFNTVARERFWKWIGSRLSDWAKAEYAGNPTGWGPRKWENWYRLCAAIVQTKIVLR
jgi:hypothetical protein